MSRRPRIDLVAPPMSVHLHPILGIGRGLCADADVRVISTGGAQAEIAAAGLSGHAMLVDQDASIAAIVNPPHAIRSNPLRLNAQLTASLNVLEKCQVNLRALWLNTPPDLVVADFTVPVAGSVATERGIRWWTSLPSPCAMETPDGPPAYLGGWKPRPGPLGRLRDAAGRLAVGAFKRGVHWMHRDQARRLGFPSVYRRDGVEAIYSPECVLAVGLRELEFARQFPASVEFVGPVLYTPPFESSPPAMRVGRTHVLVTIGTHLGWRKDAVSADVREAARALPDIDFHISDGDRNSTRQETEGNVHRCGFISYARDLPRYDLVVHHAGTGVLAHTLAAGLPALVVPTDYDQFDYAARLEVAGVAVRVTHLTDLATLIPRVLADQAMKARCRQMQRLLAEGRAEDRVAALVSQALSGST